MARDDIADFGTYLAEERHASQNTICSYLRDVTQFSEYLAEHQGCGLRQADGTVRRLSGPCAVQLADDPHRATALFVPRM